MGKETKIGWTDSTFNPWWGCTKVSPGCDHCYAETFDKRVGGEHWGKGAARRIFKEAHWREPLMWNEKAATIGKQWLVFCGSMCDVMDDEAPRGQRDRLWDLIDRTPNLLWLLLTKRPHRYKRYLPPTGFKHANVMLGATMESQPFYDIRMPHLHDGQQYLEMVNDLNQRSPKRVETFVSYEPAIGPLSIKRFSGIKPDWIIVGGETGGKDDERRPFDRAWADRLKLEAAESGVRFYMKQMSARTPDEAAALVPVDLLIRQRPGGAL